MVLSWGLWLDWLDVGLRWLWGLEVRIRLNLDGVLENSLHFILNVQQFKLLMWLHYLIALFWLNQVFLRHILCWYFLLYNSRLFYMYYCRLNSRHNCRLNNRLNLIIEYNLLLNVLLNGWLNVLLNGWLNGWLNVLLNDVWLNMWLNGWLNVWLNVCLGWCYLIKLSYKLLLSKWIYQLVTLLVVLSKRHK